MSETAYGVTVALTVAVVFELLRASVLLVFALTSLALVRLAWVLGQATESQRGGGSPTTLNIEVAVVMFVLYVLYLIFYFRSPEGASPPARGTRHSARWPRSCCSPRRPRQSPTSRRPLSAPSSR